jgi:magnesium transporter
MIVDCAIYEDGRRRSEHVDVEAALTGVHGGRGFVWIGLHEPTTDEFETATRAFGLHPLAVEDAVHAHQRPKLEHYGESVFVVLKPARYVDSEEVIEVGQIMVFLGADFVVTVRHGESAALTEVRRDLEDDPDRLRWGPASVLHAVADKVVDDYERVMISLDDDIDQIEEQVFSGPDARHAERIFKLKREVIDFRRAVEPLEPPMRELARGAPPADDGSAHYFRDVHDHVLRVAEHLAGLDALLDGALAANVAQVGMRQNEDMRKISAWVAMVVLPTLIAGIYGMNFDHMPELGWRFGYPMVLLLMAGTSFLLYRNFKRRGWL